MCVLYIASVCVVYTLYVKDFVLSVWEERKVRLYGEHANTCATTLSHPVSLQF